MKLKLLKYREFIAKLKKIGLEGPISGGKHPHFLFGNIKIIVPNPHGGDVDKNIVKKIISKIGITVEEFFKL